MKMEKRVRHRLRLNLLFHTFLSIILCVLAVKIKGFGFLTTDRFYLSLFLLNIFSLLIKFFFYMQEFTTIKKYYWLFDLLDISLLSLAYHLGGMPFNYLFPFYLVIIFNATREIVPGEVKVVTLFSLVGYGVNLFLLWDQMQTSSSRYPGFHLAFDLTLALSSLFFTGAIAHLLARQDYNYINSMRKILQEKEEHLNNLNKVNASLEEKYAASYTLSLIQQYIHQELYESELLTKITDIVQGVLGCTFTAIYGLTPEHTLDLLAQSGVKDFSHLLQVLREQHRLPFQALAEQRLLGWESANPGEMFLLRKQKINSILCIPLYTKEVKIGVLTVSHFQADFFKKDQRELLQIIGNQLSLAMENIKLHQATEEMAWHDQLTGLYNRGYFNTYLETLISNSVAQGVQPSFSCLLFDIDHFKQVNDLYGHLLGDQVLKAIASTLKNYTDQDSIAIRYGGEEFLILSTSTDLTSLKNLAEKIRRQICLLTFEDQKGGTFSVTISCGIAAIPEHAATTVEVFQKADEALYQAKEAGRNQIVVYNKG